MNPIFMGDDYRLYSDAANTATSRDTRQRVYSVLYLVNHSLKYRLVYALLEACK